MEKSDAVATLGDQAPALASLLRPAQVRAALKANDRLKLYLSVLQAAHAHAHHPREAALDLSREIAAADITVRAEADWLHDLPATAASEADGALRVAARAKAWERHADQLVVHARELAEHQPQWRPLMQLLHHSDDVADALEEACFVLSLLAEHVDATPAMDGWTAPVRQVLTELADAVLNAVQDHVKALAVARTLGEASAGDDQSEYLSAAWRVQQAERHCDELLRRARRELATQCREQPDAVALTLGNELAAAIEQASDALLTLGWGLRERTMQRMGVAAA